MKNKLKKGPMHRIKVKYRSKDGNIASCLRIYDDIKGYTCKPVGLNFFGEDAEIMLELLKNVDYSKIDNCMPYGISVDGKEI